MGCAIQQIRVGRAEGETPGPTNLFVRIHAREALVFTARLPSLTSDVLDFFFGAVGEVARVIVCHIDGIGDSNSMIQYSNVV
jgi:hypothetical protein